MKMPKLPLTGRCRCGTTVLEVTAAPVMTAACHCQGCQRMSASAFSLTAMFPAEAFRVVAGAPVKGGAKGEELSHYCCPDCMNWMFTRITGVDAWVNLRPTMLDEVGWFTPFVETMTRDKLPWVDLPVAHSYEGFPEMDDFMRLLARFQAGD